MRALRVAVSLAGVVGLVFLAVVVHGSPLDTLGGLHPLLLVLEVGAALALLAVAALGPPRAASVLVAVVGAAWLVPELAGGVDVPPLAGTVSDAVTPVLVAALLVALVLRSGRSNAALGLPVVLTVAGATVASSAR